MKKAPVSSLPPGGERRGKTSWCGHYEMRCGSLTCSGLAQCNPPRLASFVTNGAFSRPITTRQQEQQQDPFVYKRVSADINGGGGGGGLGGSHLLTDFPARAQCRRQRLRLGTETEASWRLWLTR